MTTKLTFEVCEKTERKKLAETRFVSPADAEADVAHGKEQSLRVLEEARTLDRGSGFLPRPLHKIFARSSPGRSISTSCSTASGRMTRCAAGAWSRRGWRRRWRI